MTNIIKKNKWLLVIFTLFIFTRFLGLEQIYHQDEYRWASMVNPVFEKNLGSHPPMTRWTLGWVGSIGGYDNLRAVPFIFSILNLWLIYLISLRLSGKKSISLIAAGLFAVNVYSLIANLQIDIDGAILPFFILLSYYGYLNILEKKHSKMGFTIFFLAVIGGFLTKLSFLLFLGALVFDQLLTIFQDKEKFSLKTILKKVWPWIAGVLAITVVFYYFYATHLRVIIDYAEHFKSLNFSSRAYFDLIFKIFKSFVWLSPFLTLPVLYGFFSKEMINKYRVWFIYLLLNLFFYLVLFDFATLTVERYFMFLIVPSVLIGAQVVSDLLEKQQVRRNFYIMASVVFILISYVILSLPHDIIPLNPKEAYVERIKSLDFNFLIPFTGGSGPSGFYFSAWFIVVNWLVAITSLIVVMFSRKKRSLFLAIFIVFGFGYNILFSYEYLSGAIYGSVDKVAKETIEYVNLSDSVKEVITYYDIGAYYLRLKGKYSARFYTAPKRDYVPRIESYKGQYMIVDFPSIDRGGRYWPLISRCPLLKKFQDKKVESYVFDCSKI